MKIVISFLIFFSSFGLCNDAEFQKEVIGSWTIGQQDEYFGTEWFVTEYKSDGTAIHRQFVNASCLTTSLVIEGSWSVKDGKLINVVLSSSGEFDIPKGTKLIDQIMQLSDGKMILTTESSRTAYRIKSGNCL